MATSQDSPVADDEESSSSLLDAKRLIIYNLSKREGSWKPYGNHRVFCGGCVIIGPIRSWWWLLELFLIIITISFILEYNSHNLVVWIIGLVLFLVVFGSSWKTLMADPGILKKPQFSVALDNAENAARCLHRGSFKSTYTELYSADGEPVRHTYCFRCHVWRPPECGHCNICMCCQLEWDHHCPIFGGCVAKKNLVSFHIMAVSIPVFVVYLLVVSVIAGIHRYEAGKATSVLTASFVADEILIGIVLAFFLPPLLALLPCEKVTRDQPPDNVRN